MKLYDIYYHAETAQEPLCGGFNQSGTDSGTTYGISMSRNVIRKENEDGYNTFYDMMHEVGNG